MADLLQLLRTKVDPSKIVKVSGAKGGEYHSPCPLCGGDDRFMVFPDQEGGELCQQHGITGTWACRQGCVKGGDMIDWYMKVEGLEFKAALAELGIPCEKQDPARRPYRPLHQPVTSTAAFAPQAYAAPSVLWQAQATKLAGEAHEAIFNVEPVLRWLERRGLPEAAVRRYRLGYIEGSSRHTEYIFRDRAAFGLPEKTNAQGKPVRAFRIPRGVTIPAWGPDGRVLRMRIRRRDIDRNPSDPKDPKYLLVPQPDKPYSAPLMLPPDGVAPDLATWVIVEAELDAMALHHACQGTVGVLSILTAKGKPDEAAHAALSHAARILVALDADEDKPDGTNPGADAWPWWQATYAQARLWPVPQGKDPGEAFALGVDLAAWIRAALPRLDGMGQAGIGSVGKNFLSAAVVEGGGEKRDVATQQSRPAAPRAQQLQERPRYMQPIGSRNAPGRPQDRVIYTPLGPADSLRVLAGLGLTVEPAYVEGQPDFLLHGHERWPMRDIQQLMTWTHKWSHFVLQALYGDSGNGSAA